MIKVAIKYCGGCNPRYDRRQFVDRLAGEFPDVAVVGANDEGEPDLVLVVNGCSAVCANHAHLNGKHGKIVVHSDEEYAKARAAVADILAKRK